MTWRMAVVLPVLLAAGGCTDFDGDGLSNSEERELGLNPRDADSDGDGLDDRAELAYETDPLVADSDEDRLEDGAEVDLGSDPLNPDTDGDGYADGDEVNEGSDPLRRRSKIYEGGWPYYWDKDGIANQNNDSLEVGERVRRFSLMVDQFGDEVDLYDFFNREGKPVVIDVSAEWCPPCQDVAAWLEGANFQGWESFDPLREAVNNGDVYWITVMGEDINNQDAYPELAERWAAAYPNEHVPVVADPGREHQDFVVLRGWPTTYVLQPNLTVAYRSQQVVDFMLPAIELLNEVNPDWADDNE